jgi:hypothetical protein
MKLRDSTLDPALESLLRPPKINWTAPPELRMRALSRARAFVAADGAILPSERPAPLISVPSPPRRARVRIAFAAALAVAAGTAVAVAAFRMRAPEPTPLVMPISQVAVRAGGAAQRIPSESPSHPVIARAPRPAKLKGAPSRAGGAEHGFTSELELLQRAQVAYTSRAFPAALELIAEHARRYSRGHLAEEREALRIRCLRGAGRTNDAHRAATEFAVRFPRSVLLPRVDSAESD